MLQFFAVAGRLGPLLAAPPAALLTQALVRGDLQGVIGVTPLAHAIRVLAVSNAVLFPAVVPAISMLIGIPITGELPATIQIWGLVVVTIGLLTAIGVLQISGRRKLRIF
jgi:hypothetical protein